MYQLRNMIGRRNVSSDPIQKFNECEDFFKLITNSHILVAAMQCLKMTSVDSVPSVPHLDQPDQLWMETTEKRQAVLHSICTDVIDQFISFEFNKPPLSSNDKVLQSLLDND